MNSFRQAVNFAMAQPQVRPLVEAPAPTLHLVERPRPAPVSKPAALMVITALTALAIAIHGYHPYAEDGGIYLMGIKKLLHPSLYPYWSGFVTLQLRYSLFAPMVAALVRATRLSLMTVMLVLYFVTTWLTLFAAWLIATRCYLNRQACYGAIALLGLWLTLPVAGTSLLLMDPYVTARSISTPFALFALAAALYVKRGIDEGKRTQWGSIALLVLSLVIAFFVHPLMTGYALGCILLLACLSLPAPRLRITATTCLCLTAVLLAACVDGFSPLQTPQYARVANTRTYWFLSSWHWYELLGAIAPPLVLAMLKSSIRQRKGRPAVLLADMAIVASITGLAIAALFARGSSHSLMVARLQPLRIFQIVYILMILAIGAAVGEGVLKRHLFRWVAVFALLGGVMLFVQLTTFPNSAHIEFPWVAPTNEWEQGFVWIRDHTAQDSVIAMDANYITDAGEDAQNFRAIADRSAIPDYSKDGGLAAIAPDLTADWIAGEAFQQGLDRATDPQRIAILRVSSARWVVLSQGASTQFDCPYSNNSMKVCRVPGV
ncbi:MAG TPA: hypothetical protein VH308_03005 [Terracidiphilus sp.]|nr:hypothetical protein [Terracidiphilus sp.]